jgi:hypothetical protein
MLPAVRHPASLAVERLAGWSRPDRALPSRLSLSRLRTRPRSLAALLSASRPCSAGRREVEGDEVLAAIREQQVRVLGMMRLGVIRDD